MGDYATHLGAWFDVFPKDQILVVIFEEDVCANAISGLTKIYEFLGLDSAFRPSDWDRTVHKSWNWTRIIANYYAGPLRSIVNSKPAVNMMLKHDWLKGSAVSAQDVEFLREFYLPSRDRISAMVGRPLDTWKYGADLPWR